MKVNILFLIFALIAEVVGTLGGFGSSLFFVPIGNFFFSFHQVLGLTAVFHLSSNLSKIMLFKQGLDKKLLLQIGIPSVLFVLLGSWLSKYGQNNILELILAIFLIIFSLLFIIKNKLVVPASKSNNFIGGALSGFSAGLLGTGGAIRGVTMAAYNLPKAQFIATSAAIDMAIDTSRTISYARLGYIEAQLFIYVPFLFVIGLIGTYIGKKLLKRIPQKNFRQLSLYLTLLIGFVMLY